MGCTTGGDKRSLVRFVRTPEGEVQVDPTGKANGRGAYTCPTPECFDRAIRTRKLAGALRVNLTEYDIDRLRADFERAIADAPKPARTVN